MINKFRGEFMFLSNFSPCNKSVWFEGVQYPTSEHAYQAAKTFNRLKRIEIAALDTPGQAKRAGARLVARPDWDEVKVSIMKTILTEKFTRNLDLAKKLLETGDKELIEVNTWGVHFGVFVMV